MDLAILLKVSLSRYLNNFSDLHIYMNFSWKVSPTVP